MPPKKRQGKGKKLPAGNNKPSTSSSSKSKAKPYDPEEKEMAVQTDPFAEELSRLLMDTTVTTAASSGNSANDDSDQDNTVAKLIKRQQILHLHIQKLTKDKEQLQKRAEAFKLLVGQMYNHIRSAKTQILSNQTWVRAEMAALTIAESTDRKRVEEQLKEFRNCCESEKQRFVKRINKQRITNKEQQKQLNNVVVAFESQVRNLAVARKEQYGATEDAKEARQQLNSKLYLASHQRCINCEAKESAKEKMVEEVAATIGENNRIVGENNQLRLQKEEDDRINGMLSQKIQELKAKLAESTKREEFTKGSYEEQLKRCKDSYEVKLRKCSEQIDALERHNYQLRGALLQQSSSGGQQPAGAGGVRCAGGTRVPSFPTPPTEEVYGTASSDEAATPHPQQQQQPRTSSSGSGTPQKQQQQSTSTGQAGQAKSLQHLEKMLSRIPAEQQNPNGDKKPINAQQQPQPVQDPRPGGKQQQQQQLTTNNNGNKSANQPMQQQQRQDGNQPIPNNPPPQKQHPMAQNGPKTTAKKAIHFSSVQQTNAGANTDAIREQVNKEAHKRSSVGNQQQPIQQQSTTTTSHGDGDDGFSGASKEPGELTDEGSRDSDVQILGGPPAPKRRMPATTGFVSGAVWSSNKPPASAGPTVPVPPPRMQKERPTPAAAPFSSGGPMAPRGPPIQMMESWKTATGGGGPSAGQQAANIAGAFRRRTTTIDEFFPRSGGQQQQQQLQGTASGAGGSSWRQNSQLEHLHQQHVQRVHQSGPVVGGGGAGPMRAHPSQMYEQQRQQQQPMAQPRMVIPRPPDRPPMGRADAIPPPPPHFSTGQTPPPWHQRPAGSALPTPPTRFNNPPPFRHARG